MRYLILYMLTVNPDGGLASGHWVQQAYPTEAACKVALERAIDDWRKIAPEKAGVIGRCSEKPLTEART